MIEQAMDAGYANVIERLGAIAHHAGGEARPLPRRGMSLVPAETTRIAPFPDDFGAALDGDHA